MIYYGRMFDNIFLSISILFGITVTIAVIVRLLRQPFIVAYIIAGIVAGPLFLNLIHGDQKFFHSFSEFGVVLLLFVVGLSLDLNHIKKLGSVSLVTGIGQLIFTVLFGLPLLLLLGLSFTSSLYLAAAVTFSSTIIVIKLLADKKALETVYGRYTVGLLLVQDVIAIALMTVITTVGQNSNVANSAGTLLLKGLGLSILVYGLSKIILPLFLDKIARSSEFLFVFTLAWCFGIASLVYWTGFSIEIGAIVAGISLGSSPYHWEISSRIKPLRDFFIVIFFIILGSELSLTDLRSAIAPSVALSLFIIIGNPIILSLIYRAHKFTRRNSFLAGIAAAQVSEFGFIMIFTGREIGHLSGNELSIFTLTALITIIISSYLITYNEIVYERLSPLFHFFAGKDKYRQAEESAPGFDAWVIGYHRIGWKVCEALTKKGVSFAVIDYNPEAIAKLKKRGIPAYFGDIADVEFLEAVPIKKAKLIIMTVPDHEPQLMLTKYARTANKKTVIIGNLNHKSYLDELYKAGISYVMMPHLLGASWIGDMLQNKPWTKRTFDRLRDEQKHDLILRHTAGVNS